VAIPDLLTKKGALGDVERQAVKAHYDNATEETPPFDDYRAYNQEPVKVALMKLFHEKCAYCESQFGHITPGDVEHFRPKNQIRKIDGTIKKPGYYWLASDWDNLLMSCEFCNRKRKQEVEDEARKISMGKQDHFALRVGATHALPYEPIEGEEEHRLLIDPCTDNPEHYLEFDEGGNIKPKVDKNGMVSDRGEYTIRILGLQRLKLVRRRRRFFLKQVKKELIELEALRKVIDLLGPVTPANQAAVDAQNDLIDRKVNDLLDLLEDVQEYAGLARQYLKPILKDRLKPGGN
jgi:uncharacterized protein (TIGR02646 family)